MSTPRLLSINNTIPRLTSLASRNILLQTRPAGVVQRPFSSGLVFAMTSQTSQKLDKSTPESTWQQVLSTDQVGVFALVYN